MDDDHVLPPTTTRSLILERDDGQCIYCGRSAGDEAHLDHVIPISEGGEDVAHNVATSCPKCNLEKGAKKLPRPKENRIISLLFVRNHEAGIDSFGEVKELAKARRRRLERLGESMTSKMSVTFTSKQLDEYRESEEHKEWLQKMRLVWAVQEEVEREHQMEATWENVAKQLRIALDYLESIGFPNDGPQTTDELLKIRMARDIAEDIEVYAMGLNENELEDGFTDG